MKWVFSKPNLVSGLSRVVSVIPTRSSRPIVRNLVMEANENGEVELIGTDLEIGMRVQIQAESVVESGRIALDAHTLYAHIQDSPSELIEISSVSDDEIEHYVVNDGESKATFMAAPIDDFPDVSGMDADGPITISSSDMARMITQTQYAAAREEKKYAINGLYMTVEKNNIEVVATDGHRLAVSKGILTKEIDEAVSAIVPVKVMSELLRLCQDMDDEETVQLAIDDRTMIIHGGNVVMSCQLVEGNFPRYRDVIPKNCDHTVSINRVAFARLLKRSTVMTSEDTRAVNLEFSGGKLIITSRSADKGEGEYTCEASWDGDSALKLAFTPASLLDVIRILDSDEFVVRIHQPDQPVVIEKENEFTYVIMPVRPR